MAEKKSASSKRAKKSASGSKKSNAKKAKARKPAKKAKARKAGSAGRTTGFDKSIEEFRTHLERNVTVSRDRLQEVVDDAVKRGRMTRGDAEKIISELIKRGRKQTDSLLKELERLVKQARRDVQGRGRSQPVRKQATQAARRAAKKLG
jgi:polyhydroxyalkanoate synthesis regulator phasin